MAKIFQKACTVVWLHDFYLFSYCQMPVLLSYLPYSFGSKTDLLFCLVIYHIHLSVRQTYGFSSPKSNLTRLFETFGACFGWKNKENIL